MPKVNYSPTKGLYQEAGSGLALGAGALNSKASVVLLTDLADAGAIRSALTIAESGTTFLVPVLSSGTQTIALPAPAADVVGCWYKFLAVGTLSQIFSVDTDVSATKILNWEPDGDGSGTVGADNKFRLTAAADAGASFVITCISTTAAIAWHVSEITSGDAGGTAEHVAG